MFHGDRKHTGRSPYDTSHVDGTEKWSFTTGAVDSSPAIGSDGTIYVGSRDNKLYAINPDGTFKWSFTTGDWVDSSPAIGSDGTIYVGSRDNKLYAINADGTEKWSFSTGDSVTSSPAIGSDGIYVGSEDGNLYAIGSSINEPSAPQNLQTTSGDEEVELTWDAPSDDGGSSITDYKIYRGTSSGNLSYHDNVGGNTTSYTDTGLTNGQTYYYKVSAENIAREGPNSTEISVTPSSEDDDGGGNSEGGEDSDKGFLASYWWLILAVIIGLVAMVALLVRKKKGSPQGGLGGEPGTKEPRRPPSRERPPRQEPPDQKTDLAGKTPEEKLEELKSMKERGLITEEQFKEKREDILENY